MRWFKHFSDNYRGRSVTSFHRNFGHTGIAWYYLLTEICTEKLERTSGHDITETDCTFSFDKAFIESSLRGTFAKIERWLGHGAVMGLWSFTVTEHELHVKYPILLELLDSDQRKTRSRRVSDAARARLDIEVDKEKEEDRDVDQDSSMTVLDKSNPVTKEKLAEEVRFKNDLELKAAIPEATTSRWHRLYDDPSYLEKEIIKAFNYYETNPRKRPKTLRGWITALSSWFERGWSRHVKTIKPEASQIDWDREAEYFIQAVGRIPEGDLDSLKKFLNSEDRYRWFIRITRRRISEMPSNQFGKRELAKLIKFTAEQLQQDPQVLREGA